MADEWIPIELYGANNDGGKRRVTIADGVSVSIGALLQLLDPRTASYGHLAKVAIVGVAAEEHIADKKITSIAIWTDGVFDVKVSGAVVLGAPLMSSLLDNQLQAMKDGDTSSSSLITTLGSPFIPAYALETGTSAEVINVRLKL